MEPEMSHSTTRRRGRTRRARRASRIASPPLRRASRSVRRRSGRLPSRAARYLRVRRGGTARVISRISVTSCRSSPADSSVKSRPRSRSAAEATWRTAGASASGSSASSAAEPLAETCIPADQPSGSPGDWGLGWGPPSCSARGNAGWTGGIRSRTGEGVPNSAANTRSNVIIWPGSDTMVARAQARSSATEVAPMTVTARASRSQRSGPTGSPAVCRAIPRPAAIEATSGWAPSDEARWWGGKCSSVKGADHRRQAGPAHRFLVFWVLQHRAQGLVGHRDGQFPGTEDGQREGPADRLRDAGRLGEVEAAQPVDRGRDLSGQPLPRPGYPAPDDLRDAGGVRVGDPVVQAPALERVVQVPGPVRGQHGDRGQLGLLGAEFGDRDRRLGQQLEQEGLELVVGPVNLVDEQDRGPGTRVQQGGEQGPRQQVLLGEQVLVPDVLASRLGEPDSQQLTRIVPLVQRLGGRDALVALQPDQRGVDRRGQGLSGLGLADAWLALEQDRLPHPDGQEKRRPELVARQVADRLQGGGQRADLWEPVIEVVCQGAAHKVSCQGSALSRRSVLNNAQGASLSFRTNQAGQVMARSVRNGRPWMARQTWAGVSGMSACRTPYGRRASITALTTAGGEPTVADSPTPLAPIGWCGDGVTVSPSSQAGHSSDVGSR